MTVQQVPKKPNRALMTAARRLAKARAAEREAAEVAREIAIKEVGEGRSEKDTAFHLGVERSTIRRWLGKG